MDQFPIKAILEGQPTDKERMQYLMLFSYKKERSTNTHYNMDEP